MIRINPPVLFAGAALISMIAAATPFYAIFLTVGWTWRLWIGIVKLALSLAIYSRKAVYPG